MSDNLESMKKIVEEHPSLFHYTTLLGVEGIISTNTLRATHYKFLNDSQELTHAKIILRAIILPEVTRVFKEKAEKNPSFKEFISKYGSLEEVVNKDTDTIIDSMYTSLFGKPEEEDQNIGGPYIVSFCSVKKEQPESISRDGLLSQWRGYGKDGGYAIEFDTKKLLELFLMEGSKYYYPLAKVLEVGYGLDRKKFPKDFRDDLDTLEKLLPQFIDSLANGEENLSISQCLDPFIGSIQRSKHEGFHEENEVRAVLCLGTERFKNEVGDPSIQSIPIKPIEYRNMNGTLVPYIILFDGTEKLPIKRVIVGPHREKKLRVKALKKQLENDGIEVIGSEIPFLG